MSAINTFTFQNFLCLPRTQCACICVFADESVKPRNEALVTSRWSLETTADGSRRLVRHWYRNVNEVKEATAGSERC